MTDVTTDADERTAAPKIALTPIFLGLLWLGTSAWTTRAEFTGTEAGLDGLLGDALAALPSTVAATMFTSATIAAAVTARFPRAVVRLLVGLGVGAGFGLLAGLATRFSYGDGPSITALALVIGGAGVIGGAFGILPGTVLEAALWATSWVLFAGVIFGVLEPQMMSMLGGGEEATADAQESAQAWAGLVQSAVTGLLAGLHASTFLRYKRTAWGWYPIAGAFGGLLLLITERLTVLGGDAVVGVLTDGSTPVNHDAAARLRHAILVLAVGAIVAVLRARRANPEYD